MLLSTGKIGKHYRIRSMQLPLQTEKRLESLGLIEHTPLEILNAKDHGVLIVKFRGSRFALGRNITSHIEVDPL